MELIPTKRIGPFVFGSKILDYGDLPLVEDPLEYDSKAKYGDWKVYKIKDLDMRIYVEPEIKLENEKIIAIACYESCVYQNINLIGLRYEQLLNLLNIGPSEVDALNLSTGIENVYDFFTLGIQVFVKEEIIVAIIAY